MSDTGLSPMWAILGGLTIAAGMVVSMLWACWDHDRGPGDYE